MKTTTPTCRTREHEILVLLQQGPRALSTLVQKVTFTRHDCRVRALLFQLWSKGEVAWSDDGHWRLTPLGANAIRLDVAS